METSDNQDGQVVDEQQSDQQQPNYDDRFNRIENQFNGLVDILNDALTVNTPQAHQQAQDAVPTSQEMEDLGFDDKQVKFINSLVEKTTQTAIKSYENNTKTMSAKQELDGKAFQRFPQLNDPNSQLSKLTESVIAKRKMYDPSASNRPDLIWSSVLEAQDLINQEKNKNFSNQENQRRTVISRGQLEGGSSSTRSISTQQDTQTTDTREWVRKRLTGR